MPLVPRERWVRFLPPAHRARPRALPGPAAALRGVLLRRDALPEPGVAAAPACPRSLKSCILPPLRSPPGSPPERQEAAADRLRCGRRVPAGNNWPEFGDPPRQGARLQGRAIRPHRARPGRERRGQGAGRAFDPPDEPPPRPAVRRGRLRDAQREPAAERALRPPEGRLHRRDRPQARSLRGRRHRDALSRRDRRGQPGAAGQAAARARDRQLPASRQHGGPEGRRAAGGRDQPRPAADEPRGDLPRGSLLPAQRLPRAASRRCASGATTSRCWRVTSCAGRTTRGARRSSRPRRWSCSSRTPGRGTSANCRT